MCENLNSDLDNARRVKSEGSKHFKDGNYEDALSKYMSSIDFYDLCSNLDYTSSQSDVVSALTEKQIVRANISQVYLSQGKYNDCILLCQRLLLASEHNKASLLDKPIFEKTRYRLCKAMGLVNKDCDPSSNLGKLNIKLEPTQWNLFPPCWSSNKTRSECMRFDRGLAKYSNENENLIIILHGFGDGPESFYDLPKYWNLEKTAYFILPGCDYLNDDLYPADDKNSKSLFSWFEYFDPKTCEWYDEFSLDVQKSCHDNIEQHLDKLIRTHLVKECGWNLDQIFLFGFSQGGTVALEYIYWLAQKNPDAHLGGVVGISTQLLGATRKQICNLEKDEPHSKISSSSIQPPVLIIHGEEDTKVLPKHNLDSVKCIQKLMQPEFCSSEFVHKMFKSRGHVMLRGANIEEMGIFYKFMANNLNGVGRKKERAALNELAEKEGWVNLKCM